MSDIAVVGRHAVRRGKRRAGEHAAGPDARRELQLALAAVWLIDAGLQFQSFMFSKAFGQMLAGSADGNPGFIARPIIWQASLVQQHAVLANAMFATIQLLLGAGIAWRRTVRPALAASIAWSLGVWWFGEGLGGVLNGAASPLNGAPGAAFHGRTGRGCPRGARAVARAVAEPGLLCADP
jgi:hypothetical protein